MKFQLILLIAYAGGLIVMGQWIGRSIKRSSDFFVAGRRLNTSLLFSTLLAANIGAGSTVGATSLAYRDGLSAWWWNGSAGIGSLLLAFWIGPRIWRLASTHGFYTVGDFLEYRYGSSVRNIVAVLLWLGTLSILAAQLLGAAAILNVVGGLPTIMGCTLAGIIVTAYFYSGGLLASAWVNRLQLVVLLVGFTIALPLTISSVGGWNVMQTLPAQDRFHDFWYSSGSGSGWTLVALLVPAFIVSPGLLQKIYGAKNINVVRGGIAANAVVLMMFAFIPTLLGMAARIHYPNLPNSDLALPTILVGNLPTSVSTLALAATFSAEISSADAILFMLTTSLSQDLYHKLIAKDASDATVLAIARGSALISGILGIGLAMLQHTVISAMSIFYALLGVSLFVPLIAGLHTRRGGQPEAMAAIGCGTAIFLAVELATEGSGFGFWSPGLIGIGASAVGFFIVFLARHRSN